MMKRNVTVGLVQMDCVMMDKQANTEKILEFLDQAAEKKVDIICFPEMCTTGYHPDLIRERYVELAEAPDGETFQVLSKKAKEYSMYIAAPIVLKSEIPGILYNGLIMIDDEGHLMGTYNKTHLWAGERYWFRPGNTYPVFKTRFGNVGMMICYDGGFPEVSRILTLNGAELILCPSAFPTRDKDMWDIYFASRALENGCFVAGINRVGTESDCEMFGGNKIFNPRGKLLAEASIGTEELLTCTIDLEEAACLREKEVVYLRDRRPETYDALLRRY